MSADMLWLILSVDIIQYGAYNDNMKNLFQGEVKFLTGGDEP